MGPSSHSTEELQECYNHCEHPEAIALDKSNGDSLCRSMEWLIHLQTMDQTHFERESNLIYAVTDYKMLASYEVNIDASNVLLAVPKASHASNQGL